MQGKLAVLLLVVVATFALPFQREPLRIIPSLNDNLANSTGGYSIYWAYASDYGYAKNHCETTPIFPSETTLAEFETKEEEDFIFRKMKEQGVTGRRLWVGAKWVRNGTFVWESGLPLRNDSSWLPGEPSQNNEESRVAVLVENRSSGFLTQAGGSLGFICEFP